MNSPRRVVFIFLALLILLIVYLVRQQRGSSIDDAISEENVNSTTVTEQAE